jgi:hypothetical protein
MKLNLLSAAVLAASLAAGTAAFAQSGDQSDTTSSVSNTSNTDPEVILQDQERMAPFYTDNTMTTLRPEAEVRQAYSGLSAGDQEQMKQNCIDMSSGNSEADQSQALKDLCGIVQTY